MLAQRRDARVDRIGDVYVVKSVASRGLAGRDWDDGRMPQDAAAKQPVRVSPPDPRDEPVLPTRSQDDTDVGWGEPPAPDDDERLNRERPPHWGSG